MLQSTKRALLNWNKVSISNLFSRAKKLEVDIVDLQVEDFNFGGLSDVRPNMLLTKLVEHHRLLRQHESKIKNSIVGGGS